jgi:hypothetical protein
MRSRGPERDSGPRASSLLGSLVVAQFALALMLSVGAGLLVRSFVRCSDQIRGSARARRHRVGEPARGRYEKAAQVKAFYQQALEAARAIPGVTAASTSIDRRCKSASAGRSQPIRPRSGFRHAPRDCRNVDGRPALRSARHPLERGRFFTDADGRTGGQVVILSEMLRTPAVARRESDWPAAQVGARVSRSPWMTVVGVVGDVTRARSH